MTVGLPDLKGRTGILEIHTRERRMADDVDLESIARAAMGMSGADLANVANEAALVAVPMAEQERRLVANHEAAMPWWPGTPKTPTRSGR